MIHGDNHLVLDTMRDDYVKLVQWCWQHGIPTSPGQTLTHEISPMTITLKDPIDSLPLASGTTLDEAYACAQALQLISGSRDEELNLRIAGQPALFPRSGLTLASKLDDIPQALELDRQTRDAYLSFYGLGLQFLVRDSHLDLHVHINAQNVIDLANDLFPWAQLQLTMANVCHLTVGALHFHAVALYMPSAALHLMDKMHPTEVLTRPPNLPAHFGILEDSWESTAKRAKFVLDVASGRIVSGVNPEAFSNAERWYLERLRPFWKNQETT